MAINPDPAKSTLPWYTRAIRDPFGRRVLLALPWVAILAVVTVVSILGNRGS